MSDLIERLQDVWDGKATFPTERLPEIIEQLKTVRGIEGLADPFSLNIRIFTGNTVFVTTNKGTFQAETLPLALAAAVEAAAKKGEGR